MRSLENVAMLTLGNTILSVSTRAGELSKSTLISKETPMCIRDVLASRVGAKSTNGRIELCAKHSGKLLVNGHKLTTRGHKIDPGKP